jgi:curved DNA-binding protein CbpA
MSAGEPKPRVDHYRVLGVPRDASVNEIRSAYRRLARRHHPDVNPRAGGSQRFRALARAYETLSDPSERARYDHAVAHPIPVQRSANAQRQQGATEPANRSPRRGILQLSPAEAAHLARSPLTLRDAGGESIVLPAGTAHGDQIVVSRGEQALVLTVDMPSTRLTAADFGLLAW